MSPCYVKTQCGSEKINATRRFVVELTFSASLLANDVVSELLRTSLTEPVSTGYLNFIVEYEKPLNL